MNVLIAGGVGRLTLGLMLNQRGIGCTVLESAPEERELGAGTILLPVLDRVGIRTHELRYANRFGQIIWVEPRSTYAGHDVPQISIHRGRLHGLLWRGAAERLGPVLRTACHFVGFTQDAGVSRLSSRMAPRSGATSWSVSTAATRRCARSCIPTTAAFARRASRCGRAPSTGRSFGMARPCALPAIRAPRSCSTRSVPAPHPTRGCSTGSSIPTLPTLDPRLRYTKTGTVRPASNASCRMSRSSACRFSIPRALVGASPEAGEYPIRDRDPLPWWTRRRVTLLGDAAHPMYPVGSNGASQAMLDARCLADLLTREAPAAELAAHEADRLPKTAAIVALNRKGGPEHVIDFVAERAPDGFSDIAAVAAHEELAGIVSGYARAAGFAVKGGISATP